jgi:epoxyqueuosine reductase
VLYAIGNSGNPSYAPLLHPLMADANPAVAEAAGWALARIAP